MSTDVTLTDETTSEAMPDDDDPTDDPVMDRIQRLAAEAQAVYGRGAGELGDQERLRRIRLQLDQSWDLVRQRLALRDAGRDPAQAQARPIEVVERYRG
jgi:hypothetical protein